MREPLSGLSRADVVVLSRADVLDAATRDRVRAKLLQYAPHAGWCEVVHAAKSLLNTSGGRESIDQLKGRRVAAFCGIGNPDGFRHTLDQLGCELVAWYEFDDHHVYTPSDVTNLNEWARQADVEMVVCTRKDLVKLTADQIADVPLWAVAVELEYLNGEQEMESAVGKQVAKNPNTQIPK